MADPTPAPLTPDGMDGVMDVQGQGPALARGLMATGAPAHHVLLFIELEAGMERKAPESTGLEHGHAPPAAIGAAAPVEESPLLGSY